MPKTVSASEAKVKFGSIMDWAEQNKDEVIVESRGKPKVVIVAFAEYEKLAELREQYRRRIALARLEALAETIQARNQDLSEEEADALADQFTREVVEEMIAEGQIKYKR